MLGKISIFRQTSPQRPSSPNLLHAKMQKTKKQQQQQQASIHASQNEHQSIDIAKYDQY